MAERWNPILINTDDNKYKHLVLESTRKQIRNILKSYVGYYDPFCELLQNAMDATERQKLTIGENYNCHLTIVINLNENTIYVADNGIGFGEDEFKTFLSPNISYKSFGKTRGNKGVGTTYLAFGFYKLEVFTKTDNYVKYVSLNNGNNWVYDDAGKYTLPEVIEMEKIDIEFPYDRGSSFKVFLTDSENNASLQSLAWRGLSSADAWCKALLTNTPLGHLNLDGKETSVKFDLKVIAQDGTVTKVSDQNARFFYTHDFYENTSQCINDVTQWQAMQLKIHRDTSNIPQKFTRKYVIYDRFTTNDILDYAERSKTLQKEETELIKKYKVVAYATFVNSVKRWDDINEKIIKARKNTRIVSPGLQISTSNMIQGDLLQIPLTSNIGYQKQSHVIVHFENAEPDLGRKGFQPEIRTIAEKISASLVSLGLRPWVKLLAADDGSNNSDEKRLDNYEYIREMEDWEKDNPLIIKNPNFFLPMREISITAKPQTEQDVIVLFNQLIAGGVIRSIDLLSTSSKNQYDGLYRVNVKEPEQDHYFDMEKNPLGVDPEIRIKLGHNTQPRFLEYKYSFDSLIQDFENEEKHPVDIGLVVVWTMGGREKNGYQIISTLLPEYKDRRRYHGFTHEVFYDITGNGKFDCIVLEELIDYLNNSNEYVEKYRDLYSEEW